MAQVNVIGRITADLELKTSEKSNPYVRFDIAENIGSRQTLHTQYFQVCAWGEDANRLMKAHAKKGSLKCLSRPKRNAPVVSFSELIGDEGGLYWEEVISRQDELFQRLEAEMCLHALAARLPRREMRIIRMKVRGDRMHDIAKRERMTFRQINQALERCYPTVISVLWG